MGFEAVDLYWTMPEKRKDSITHLCAINACSHARLIDQAQTIYQKASVKTVESVTVNVRSMATLWRAMRLGADRLF